MSKYREILSTTMDGVLTYKLYIRNFNSKEFVKFVIEDVCTTTNHVMYIEDMKCLLRELLSSLEEVMDNE